MTNVIIYNIVQNSKYRLQKLVDAFDSYFQDDVQGIVINEYSENFLKAGSLTVSYFKKSLQAL